MDVVEPLPAATRETLQLVSADRVTRVHATQLALALGLEAPTLLDLEAGQRLPPGGITLLDAAHPQAQALVAQWPGHALIWLTPQASHPAPPGVVVLHKPLSLSALREALSAVRRAPARRPAAAPQCPAAVDAGRWQELLGLFGPSGLTEMVAALARDVPQRAQELAAMHQNPAALRRWAHTLRSVADQFGAARMAELCLVIEKAANAAEGVPLPMQAESAAAVLQEYTALVAAMQQALAHD